MSDETKIKGMGAIPHAGGVGFRVWAPHAERVSVIGSFNGWDNDKNPMQAEENGYWYADVAEAHVGDQYKFLLTTEKGAFKRIDPYAREVTDSVGNAIVHDKSFDWKGDEFHLAPWNELVISRPRGTGSSVSTAIGKAITTTLEVIRAQTPSPSRVSATAFPSTPRFTWVLTAC